jgi:hypothetical protein
MQLKKLLPEPPVQWAWRLKGNIMTIPEGVSAISYIESLYVDQLEPADIQSAINELEPGQPRSVSDAEVILGIAASGVYEFPNSEDWAEIHERAFKIFNREASLQTK